MALSVTVPAGRERQTAIAWAPRCIQLSNHARSLVGQERGQTDIGEIVIELLSSLALH
ncbi:MAG TPA: hypothetical protein VJ731_11640 [Terriglobales bacterium]|nr:hypothetical protein [Terriglobales bacterium]